MGFPAGQGAGLEPLGKGPKIEVVLEPPQEHLCCWLCPDPALSIVSSLGLNSRQGTPASLLRNNLAVLAVPEKFSGLLWVSSPGLETEPRAPPMGAQGFCQSPVGSTLQSCRHFSVYPALSTHSPSPGMAPGPPSVLPVLSPAQPHLLASVLDPKRPWGQEKKTVE